MGVRLSNHPRYLTIDRTIRRSFRELLDLYAAHHIGVSKKYKDGRKLSLTCITFYVLKKGARHPGRDIPSFLEIDYQKGRGRRVATDVCEILEQPVGLSIRGGNAIISSDNEQGTVGLVFERDGRDFLVTNAHVVTDPGVLPGPVTVGLPNSAVSIQGIVRRMDDLSGFEIHSDAALVEVPPNSVDPGKFRGSELVLVGYSEIVNNDARKFFFVSMNFVYQATWSAWVAAPAPIDIDGQTKHYAGFHKFRVVVGQAVHGNSGSVVFCVSASGLVAVGLLFGGSPAINEVWVFNIKHSLAQLGIAT